MSGRSGPAYVVVDGGEKIRLSKWVENQDSIDEPIPVRSEWTLIRGNQAMDDWGRAIRDMKDSGTMPDVEDSK